ncbi:MAG: methylthioadenosine phosphorylase [Elusimicrobia bacterium RIFCSPLOWO2_12_FULL_59_9]|nr:MAG: methylthioadenosine phosphorylase [Elusimicrobia bacterium RIFCSPLOWO2_12_FULL_59_9]
MKKKSFAEIGIIGGSGLYEIGGVGDVREVRLKTPFGSPSDAVVLGTLSGARCAFLPRHGKGHRLLPTEINYRANLYALKSLGVRQVLSLSAVGSLKEELAPRHFVFPDQLIDETKTRAYTFFGGGVVAHVSLADPFCPGLSLALFDASQKLSLKSHLGGAYICMEGPAFSSRAESQAHKKMGCSIIGMTASPEAKLAREAEMCYAAAAMVTDYDVWKDDDGVNAAEVMATLKVNSRNAKRLVAGVLPALLQRPACACQSALKAAIITSPQAIAPGIKKKLGLLIGKYV